MTRTTTGIRMQKKSVMVLTGTVMAATRRSMLSAAWTTTGIPILTDMASMTTTSALLVVR